MADRENHAVLRHISVDHCILLLKHLSTHMHFITNGYRMLFKDQFDRSKATFFFKEYVLFVGQKTQCLQIYTKLTQFEDNDSRKLPWKYYLLKCCSF